jgi:exodeoxyribonuclease VII small subunit
LSDQDSAHQNRAQQDRAQETSFEEALTRLETIVHTLEDGEVGLGDALGHYEAGVKLLKHCYGLLERAERRIELLCGTDAQGNPRTAPFDDEASLSLDAKGTSRSQRRSQREPKPAAGPGRSATDPPPEIDERRSLF